jgi:hypothetical protein
MIASMLRLPNPNLARQFDEAAYYPMIVRTSAVAQPHYKTLPGDFPHRKNIVVGFLRASMV